MAIANLAIDYLISLFLWIISETFGFTFVAVFAVLAKKYLVSENQYRRKKFITWTRIMLLIPPIFSSIFLQFAGTEAYWRSLAIVVVVTIAIMYYPQTVLGFVDVSTVLLDRCVAAGIRFWRMLHHDEN